MRMVLCIQSIVLDQAFEEEEVDYEEGRQLEVNR